MSQITINITAVQEKVLLTDMAAILEWLENAISVKYNLLLNTVIEEFTDKNPRKMTITDKETIAAPLQLKTAKEKEAERLI